MHRPNARTAPPVLVALVFLVALNLRPSLTSVGPLLPQIGADLGLGEGLQGLLGTLPLLAFAAVSPLVHRLSARLGPDRAVLVALLVLAAGTVVRSALGSAGLWLGTVLVGSGIAVGNVLVPALVKRDYPAHVARATGAYSAFLTLAAATASAVAVPLSGLVGWRGALAAWGLLAVVVAVLWLPRTRLAAPVPGAPSVDADDEPDLPGVWTQGTAWLITAFMGLQSVTFYVMVTWLPTIEVSRGTSPEGAGLHLFTYVLVGIVGALAIPLLLARRTSAVVATVTASLPMVLGATGLLLVPSLGALWVVVAGLGSGASLVVALTLMAVRGRSRQETTRLSGMAQSVGYLLAAGGPVLAGVLAERSGGWTASLVLVLGLALAQLAVALPAGLPRRDAARA